MLILLPMFLSPLSSGLEQVSSIVSSRGVIVYSNEAPDGYVYLGAWLQGSMPDVYNEWVSTTGKGLAIYATMAVFGYPDTSVPNTGAPWISLTQRLQGASPWIEQGLYDTACITWQTQYAGDDGADLQWECMQRVANGEYDSFIRENARWIKANIPYKLFIRLNHEFNLGNWGWSRDANVYKDAWKRVVDIFREEDVNPDWVWCANWNDNPSNLHFQDYYPSDSYVDWVGVDIYAASWATDAETELGWNDNAIYNFALSHNKPVMIAEWGLNITGYLTDEQNAYWLTTFFDGIEARPEIKAIVHWGGWNWYLLNYPATTEVYKNRVRDSRYSAVYP
jgi:hypothetical protein